MEILLQVICDWHLECFAPQLQRQIPDGGVTPPHKGSHKMPGWVSLGQSRSGSDSLGLPWPVLVTFDQS